MGLQSRSGRCYTKTRSGKVFWLVTEGGAQCPLHTQAETRTRTHTLTRQPHWKSRGNKY